MSFNHVFKQVEALKPGSSNTEDRICAAVIVIIVPMLILVLGIKLMGLV